MGFVQVPQNIPEPWLPTAQEVGEREVQMFSVLQVFCESLCLGPANQTNQGVRGGFPSSLLQGRWMKSLWWDFHLSPEAGGPACPPPSALPPNSLCATWSQIQHTGYYSPLSISLTNDRKEIWLKTREHISFFISSWIALGTVFSFKLKWVKLQCPLFATHRSLLNQMFLIL